MEYGIAKDFAEASWLGGSLDNPSSSHTSRVLKYEIMQKLISATGYLYAGIPACLVGGFISDIAGR